MFWWSFWNGGFLVHSQNGNHNFEKGIFLRNFSLNPTSHPQFCTLLLWSPLCMEFQRTMFGTAAFCCSLLSEFKSHLGQLDLLHHGSIIHLVFGFVVPGLLITNCIELISVSQQTYYQR